MPCQHDQQKEEVNPLPAACAVALMQRFAMVHFFGSWQCIIPSVYGRLQLGAFVAHVVFLHVMVHVRVVTACFACRC